ncbi:hypothetical protein RFI_24231 [Reticulomyxa filosa]|uniref:Acyloxyacyl hydrolase n=1 Tax=Reticulomyxa filosa TaxID=46433 RepID=X6MI80_RETFI|nr:hypothetical protein RFI_24231 [Reticulomyxa filosa]|eukprot:ETO13142.1 hypothetical protein RFI_24231 [Reticulomyxa filosa]
MWCEGTGQMGVALLGDSAGAHFHIPAEWMNVTEMTAASWADTYFILLMELDWPFLSGTTAMFNSTEPWQNVIQGPVDSLYLRMLQQNRCNHRDFQNLGVNGARSGAMASQLDQTLRRDASTDHPVFLVYELIGNDVCSGHHTFETMTTPEEFYQNNLQAFQYLDSKLPYGSRVLALGLANGSVLYDAMNDRIHPIGALNNDVTYTNVYVTSLLFFFLAFRLWTLHFHMALCVFFLINIFL